MSLSEWRKRAEAELGGASFDEALVYDGPDGRIEPVYAKCDVNPGAPGEAPYVRGVSATPEGFALCMRHDLSRSGVGALGARITADVSGGAEALWLSRAAWEALVDKGIASFRSLVGDIEVMVDGVGAAEFFRVFSSGARGFTVGADLVTEFARGETNECDLGELVSETLEVCARSATGRAVVVSTVAFHDAGCDAVDEVALSLSTGVLYIEALLDAGLSVEEIAKRSVLRVCVGRDTFGEVVKLRALRLCWHKLLAGYGGETVAPPKVHAVSAWRTLTRYDPMVNLLRVTGEMVSGALGGAHWATPFSWDEASGGESFVARRAARNTVLVLREEGGLAKVIDPVGGGYFFETRTDRVAREAWKKFQALEARGGVLAGLRDGSIAEGFTLARSARRQRIATRKEAIVGVTDFAVEGEVCEERPRDEREPQGLGRFRDAEDFEALRDDTGAMKKSGAKTEVGLLILGQARDLRARVGFARGVFAAGGMPAREVTVETVETVGGVVCICGTDETVETEGAEVARVLKSRGVKRVLVAGRGGASEERLRLAGVDGFVFRGCDVVAELTAVIEALR